MWKKNRIYILATLKFSVIAVWLYNLKCDSSLEWYLAKIGKLQNRFGFSSFVFKRYVSSYSI